ncbi:hypothetical protein METBIDRAFT_44454 [Metschnikowia bicuspidata var. bicuspidata NRRL YB-4993]|uniref:AMP-dependent synthetase/ligase domain-containing protein n=1 Tax=Metschnikowia bicuspidata var. bicuspidata NRRL YB-4993 TaxID=869754 RepID=A0A1A0H793_9ASCO|nr:hypothetical protein METBIDRAFT_44454 [Metschnikowia bicuspidata var. bicuspidata NRRL YB-4993]OBA19767.1 hypothetical protein METBIDRAFT_44454 [Metschnikowia bicuspidata var. bicuspidata NRRL YB-4993]
MENGLLNWVLLALLVTALLYRQFLVFTRDVPDEYLNEQSVIESIRKPNELAVHKSTKLDYSQGLRVGLGIRYSSYKLRNGNLYDIWELAMGHAKKDPTKSVFFDQKPVQIARLNSLASQVRKLLSELASEEDIDEVCIHKNLVFSDPEAFTVLLACFTSQTTVHIYDESCLDDQNGNTLDVQREEGDLVIYRGSRLVLNMTRTIDTDITNMSFVNEYSSEKDRGIALKVSCRANHMAMTSTNFVQTNLVSAVASCIKHFPPQHHISSDDRMAVLNNTASMEGLVNGLVKVLVSFVTGAELHLASSLDTCVALKPTIILAPTDVVSTMYKKPAGLDRLLKPHRLYSLACNRFSGLIQNKPHPDLRLVIAHRSIGSTSVSPDWRQISASLAAHVVEESGYFHAAGPILVSDFFDFRSFSRELSAQTRTHGAVAQSNELKLVNFDGVSGKIAARGYNFGKAKTVMDKVGETIVTPDEDGFYQLPVQGRWGLDGCMYVMRV